MSLSVWARVKPLQDTEAISKLEKKYNLALPVALKECILENNGARPRPNNIKSKLDERFDVKLLLSYNHEDIENIYNVVEYFIKEFNSDLIPFASDSGGNYFCMRNDAVVLWTQQGDIIDICDSFTEMLENLD